MDTFNSYQLPQLPRYLKKSRFNQSPEAFFAPNLESPPDSLKGNEDPNFIIGLSIPFSKIEQPLGVINNSSFLVRGRVCNNMIS